MTDFSSAMSVATSGMRAQAARLRHVSENIANTDTPGYRRKQISFEDAMNGQVIAGQMKLDQTALPRIYDPANPLADASGHYEGSNVSAAQL